MGSFKDLTGQRFGKLTVLGRVHKTAGNKRTKFLCVCDCGNHSEVLSQNLTSGKTNSCGCLAPLPEEAYLNKTFNALTVVSRVESKGNSVMLLCMCACGKTSTVSFSNLKSGSVKSCGCGIHRALSTTTINTDYPFRTKKNHDMVGMVVGKLTVISKIGPRGRDTYWFCLCECGGTTEATTHYLNKGLRLSCGCLHHRTGKDNPTYRGNVPPIRGGCDYESWRSSVMQRDNYTCVSCGAKRKIQAHHIMSFNKFGAYRLLDINGVTLCKKCHKEFHGSYGYGNNTLGQFLEWQQLKGFKL